MSKIYLDKNVYDTTQERIKFIFDNFKKIYVSFSGGKDSGVLLNLCIDEARKRGLKIGCLFIDLEAFYAQTIDYIEKMMFDNLDVLEPYWICLPMESPNSLSYFEPIWRWWDDDKKDIWVREMPENKYVINLNNHKFDFYNQNITFEEFVVKFGEWYSQDELTACLLGIRTNESLNRFRAITGNKSTFLSKKYSTKISKNIFNFYPIYDWDVKDIWIYNSKYKKLYNRIYDLFYKAGISIHKMRIDEPFGNEAKAGLNLFRVIEPETWKKVVNRVSGANFGNIYSGNKIMNSRYDLPKNHSWKSFTKFLLKTLPKQIADNYKIKFIKFIKYWNKVGCPILKEHLALLEKDYSKYIYNTKKFSNRGKGDKEVIKFKKIIDEIPKLDSKDDFLTWKRLAMCIIKNDYYCKSLSFSITKEQLLKQKKLLLKYKNL